MACHIVAGMNLKNVIAALEASGMSRAEIGRASGVKPETLCQIVHGPDERNTSIRTAMKLIDYAATQGVGQFGEKIPRRRKKAA